MKKVIKVKKSIFATILSVVLALLIATIPSLQIAAAETQNNVEYLAEIKIGVGETAAEAEKALEGYTILKDGNSYVDLNQKAGGGIGSKGERVVYLGYKTTIYRDEAITDLAVMNMKGGYSVKDYELLMEQYMTEQIIPFVEKFIATVKEYRNNYNSSNEENKARAQYVHDALNKLTDDDCGDAGLGDLLLNETKYEMGDAAYEALSEEEKKKHADIITIITQANGQATLLMENLITRAADTNEDTWLDRFAGTTYADLLALYPDMLPTEAEAKLAKDYDNDAREILSMWSALKEQIDNYDDNKKEMDELLAKDLSAEKAIIDGYNAETATDEQTLAYYDALGEVAAVSRRVAALSDDIATVEHLSSVEYKEGTLADFFSQEYADVENNLTSVYPLVASLTAGQRAGLEFVTLSDLVLIAVTDSKGYGSTRLEDVVEGSIYDGVEREIYQKGGVALTSEALRAHAAEEVAASEGKISLLTYVMYGVTAAAAVATGATFAYKWISEAIFWNGSRNLEKAIVDSTREIAEARLNKAADAVIQDLETKNAVLRRDYRIKYGLEATDKLDSRSAMAFKLGIGFSVALLVLSAASLYLTYRDLVNYYNVEYSPIPKYMVDEKDITAYNAKGEKIVVKNQAAYYKAVETNRSSGDEWFDILGTSADLNGTVGQQWLALYAASNENMSPIIASSLKAVVGDDKVPSGYTTGIHMFGSDAAFNINSTQFVWNNEATSVFVYFRVHDQISKGGLSNGGLGNQSGTNTQTKSMISAGHLVLVGVIGLVIGVAVMAAFVVLKKKKASQEIQNKE